MPGFLGTVRTFETELPPEAFAEVKPGGRLCVAFAPADRFLRERVCQSLRFLIEEIEEHGAKPNGPGAA